MPHLAVDAEAHLTTRAMSRPGPGCNCALLQALHDHQAVPQSLTPSSQLLLLPSGRQGRPPRPYDSARCTTAAGSMASCSYACHLAPPPLPQPLPPQLWAPCRSAYSWACIQLVEYFEEDADSRVDGIALGGRIAWT